MEIQWTDNQIKMIIRAQTDFKVFVKEIFSKTESLFPNGFIGGKYIDNICNFIQSNPRTARVSARDHFKSTSFYAHFMWTLLKSYGKNVEGHYFSYQYGMAAYHISKIKHAIKSNPYYYGIIDKKVTADSVICYTWNNQHFVTMDPHGLLEFKRGIHAPLIYVDDPFQDPANKMVITIIQKVNGIIRGQILDMVQDQIHICGTPQTNEDFFFNNEIMSRFKVMIAPAIVDESNKITLWPEWKGWDELMLVKKEKGEKLFNQEYLCRPTYAEEAYINRASLMALVNSKLINLDAGKSHEFDGNVIAGFDIGKKTHPSHLSVFHIKGKKKIQIHSKFMDHWDYGDQLEYLKMAIDNFRIDRLFYDDTRGEFEGFRERGELPDQMEPVVFSIKTKNSMAVQLDRAIANKDIEFLNDQRMLEQMLLVTNDLQAIETPEGHGDSFWSTAMAQLEEESSQPDILIL